MIRKKHPRRPDKKPVILSEEDKKYLDEVAIEVMKIYLSKQPPKDFKDSLSVSRVAYRQALAMMTVKKHTLKKLILESGIKLTM